MKGLIAAALSKKDPDYYFHWVRDSSVVMKTLAEGSLQGRLPKEQTQTHFHDFVKATLHLQSLPSSFGLGEPRYTMEGQIDPLKWSRPQWDGPALRALTLLRILELGENSLASQALLVDLKAVDRHASDFGFDIWEELKAENYHTRLVQIVALQKGAEWLKKKKLFPEQQSRFLRTATSLERKLDQHWDSSKKILRSQMKIQGTDGYTSKATVLDMAVIIAVLESERLQGPHSVMDDRVHSTLFALEELFRGAYTLNQNQEALLYGRYQGDHYYGGHPWFLITAMASSFYSRLARSLKEGSSLKVTETNQMFLTQLINSPVPLAVGQYHEGSQEHQRTFDAAKNRGLQILKRLQSVTPKDGQLYEQIHQATGAPHSSRGIGWAHACLLSAFMEFERTEKTF